MRAASAVEHSGGMEHKFGSVLSSSCMVWNGDHLFFGSESGELHIWEAATFKEVMRIKGHAGMVLYTAGYHLYITVYYKLFFPGPIICIDVAADGCTVVTGGQDKCIGLWNTS